MKNYYTIEVMQQQQLFVSVEAENSTQAIDLVLVQQGEVTQPYPPELMPNSLRIVSDGTNN